MNTSPNPPTRPRPLSPLPRVGTALATAGEDGTVKVWSRNGMLRSTLAQADSPVYSVVWAYDCDQLCYCTGSSLVIKSLASSAKQNAWRAHDGVVLRVDWSPINHLLVSGGEDCKYKVGWGAAGGAQKAGGGAGVAGCGKVVMRGVGRMGGKVAVRGGGPKRERGTGAASVWCMARTCWGMFVHCIG